MRVVLARVVLEGQREVDLEDTYRFRLGEAEAEEDADPGGEAHVPVRFQDGEGAVAAWLVAQQKEIQVLP